MGTPEREAVGYELRRRCDEPGTFQSSVSRILYPSSTETQPKSRLMYRLGRLLDPTAPVTDGMCLSCCRRIWEDWTYCPKCGKRLIR